MAEGTIPRAKYALICDDIREEKSNKLIIVGLYANRIILGSIPGLIPKLSIRICFDRSRPSAGRFDLFIVKPDGGEMGPFAIGIPPASDEFLESPVNINIVPFPLEQKGIYRIVARLGGEEELVGRFGVESLDVPRGKPS